MWGQSEATLQTGRRDQKVWYQLRPRSYSSNSLNDTQYYSIFSQVWLALSLKATWQSQSYLWKYAIILCVIQGVTRVTSWPQLISNLLVAPACLECCFWLAPHFFTPQVFLFSILPYWYIQLVHYGCEFYSFACTHTHTHTHTHRHACTQHTHLILFMAFCISYYGILHQIFQ